MEGLKALSQASVHMKSPGVGAREFTRRSPRGKTPARLSRGDITLRKGFAWTLHFCAVSLANESGHLDVNAVQYGTGKQHAPTFHGATLVLQELHQTAEGVKLSEPSQLQVYGGVPPARLNLTAHALQKQDVLSTADKEDVFQSAFVEVPEGMSLEESTSTSRETSSSCGDKKCSGPTSQATPRLLIPETDAGASHASRSASSFSSASTDGGEDSAHLSGGVTGTQPPDTSQSGGEDANIWVQPPTPVFDIVPPPSPNTPVQSDLDVALSDAAPYTGRNGPPTEPLNYDDVLLEMMFEGRAPPRVAYGELYDEVPGPFQGYTFPELRSVRNRTIAGFTPAITVLFIVGFVTTVFVIVTVLNLM